MESIPFGVDEVKELAKLLADATSVIGLRWIRTGSDADRIYQSCGVKADELAALAKRYEERYAASLAGG